MCCRRCWIADGDAGRDDQEGVREAGVLGIGALVERVPGDEHGHDNGLAGAGGHLECCARQAGIRRVVSLAYCVFDPGVAVFLCDLGDVDGGFKSFVLAEEKFLLTVGIGPIGNQACGSWSHADVAALAPQRDAAADVVHQLVFFDAILCPLRVELRNQCESTTASWSRRRTPEIGRFGAFPGQKSASGKLRKRSADVLALAAQKPNSYPVTSY
jgi:hypothetical protein